VNVAVFDPALTMTLTGTVATDVLLLDRLTDVSDGGAVLSVTVPRESSPPFTVVGFTVTDARLTPDAAVTFNVALFVTPPNDAEIVAV